MAFDKEAADAATCEFVSRLAEYGMDPRLVPGLAAMQALWREYYMTAGHRRLARALLGLKLKE